MSLKLKELSEKKGAKLKEAKAIFQAAQNEKRDLNSDEVSHAENIHNEIDGLDKQIMLVAKQVSIESAKPIDMSFGEQRDIARFDIGKLLRSMKNGQPIDGIEREVIEEGEREAQASGVEARGIFLPRSVVKRQPRNAMTATGGTNLQEGGLTIETEKQGFFDAFYNALVLRNAGAMVMEGLQGNLDLPRYVADSDPAHKAENATADGLSPEVAQLQLRPKRLPAFIDISDQLIRQSATNIEEWVRRNITMQMSAVMERNFINGNGGLNPTGILNTTGIGAVIGGTNGAAPSWADIINLETEVAAVDADIGSVHYLTNTKVRGKLKQTVRVASTDSRFIWDNNDLNGYTPLVSNAVPSNLTKGSATGVASAIIFGNFQDFVMAFWGGMSIELLRDTSSAKDGKSVLVINSYYDGGVVRPASFSAMKDALTA
jgi:HK97 family phage major capsid protein